MDKTCSTTVVFEVVIDVQSTILKQKPEAHSICSMLDSLFFLIPVLISSLSSVVVLVVTLVVTLVSVTWFLLFSQLFPLLLDCLTFGFSFSPFASPYRSYNLLLLFRDFNYFPFYVQCLLNDKIYLR